MTSRRSRTVPDEPVTRKGPYLLAEGALRGPYEEPPVRVMPLWAALLQRTVGGLEGPQGSTNQPSPS